MLKLVKDILKTDDSENGISINEMLKYVSDNENIERNLVLPRLLDVLHKAEEQGIVKNTGKNKYALVDDYESYCGTCGGRKRRRSKCGGKRRSRRSRRGSRKCGRRRGGSRRKRRGGGCGGKRRRRSGKRRRKVRRCDADINENANPTA
ncbi:hypothetical protein O3M35_010181 [Rhynocoris fuscipes]|uniref:H15 domain-containing protein n=1 Tax=Rhynocoris fuscipes TaxID=488301 RepID=A0AAW1CXY0_9HEMI